MTVVRYIMHHKTPTIWCWDKSPVPKGYSIEEYVLPPLEYFAVPYSYVVIPRPIKSRLGRRDDNP
jgi:hypothetical protein